MENRIHTRLGAFCDRVIEAGWLVAVIVVPLFFNIYSQRVFEPDKLSLLRSIALVMAVAWLIRLAETWRVRQGENTRTEPGPSLWARIVRTPLVLPTLLLALVYVITTPLSLVPHVSLWGSYQRLQGTYTTLSYMVIFFLLLDGLRTKRQLNRLINAMVLVSFPIAMYGLVQHFGLDPLPWGGNVTTRVASNMGNAIFVAAFLIMVVPLTLSRLLENWKEAVGRFEVRDGVLGVLAFVLLVGALLAGMLLEAGRSTLWVRWVALVIGVGLQVPIFLLTPEERRSRVLTISLPMTFAFLVAFSWILEIFFPPALPNYFWLGLLASIIFIVAMAAFAFYLRKPISRLLLLAAYFVILIAQVICIFYTQSRGPLLGLLGGVFFYFALLGLIKRRVWLPWTMAGLALPVAIFLVLFNTVDTPLMENLRETPYVGRLGKILQTEEGTGKVRVLIWEGVVDMMSSHEPLEYPGEEGGPDPLNAVRPIIGYGPESMYVGYNRFYPPDLAHYERRNASPDRSHNETFDALVTTGYVGFAAYMFLFLSVFYYGFKFLGLIRERWQTLALVGLYVGGGIAGAVGAWIWRGPVYIGVGIPGGVTLGLALYVLVLMIGGALRPRVETGWGGRYAMWILALLTGIVAHFIEIHFGIAIAATRTYFWAFAGLLTVIGTRLALQPTEAEEGMAASQPNQPTAQPARKRRSRSTASTAANQPRPTGGNDWQGSILVLTILAVLILGTMLFDYITIQDGDPGVLGTIWQSLTQKRGESSPAMLVLIAVTWAMIGLVGFSDLATRPESEGRQPTEWLSAIGVSALISFLGALIFAILHAMRLKPVTIASPDAANPLTHTITFYYAFIGLVMILLAWTLTASFRRTFRPFRWNGQLADIGLAVLSIALPLLTVLLILATNVSLVRADILYKQGLSSENAKQWDGAIFFYEQAIDMAKDQDFYYLFLGRAYLEKGKASQGSERQTWLQESEKALLKAREIAPLNTDHSANLARLYRTWGSLSSGEQRTRLLNQALDYYADATSLSPHNAQLWNEYGQTYYILGEPERALEMYTHSLSLDEKYAQTYRLLGEFYMQQKQWEQAAESYQKTVELTPKAADAFSALGYVYSQMGDMEAALEAYRQAVTLAPRDYNDRKNLAILYQQMGRIDEAVLEASQALELAPESEKQALQAFLVQLQQEQGETSEDAALVQTLLTQGQAYMDAEDWANAEISFRQVLDLAPNHSLAHGALAYVYARQGKIDEAITENLAVLSLIPDDYTSHKNLALLYQQKGDIEKTIAAAEKALALAPDEEREALETFLAQLRQLQGEATPSPNTGRRAGDLAPAERDGLYSAPPPMVIDPTKTYRATLVTEKGDIVIELAAAEAPQTVNNFYYLAREGFYDGLTFHRVENSTNFQLIQGGDPLGSGTGGPGYTVPAEIGLPHDAGAIAMARTGDQVNPQRASAGSQFYICLGPIHQLDGAYTVFGYVVEGLDVAQQIAVGDAILAVEITEQ